MHTPHPHIHIYNQPTTQNSKTDKCWHNNDAIKYYKKESFLIIIFYDKKCHFNIITLKGNDVECVLRKDTVCSPCKIPKATNTGFNSLLKDSILPLNK